jgi:osmoprotectant transport system permease protein
MTPDPVALAGCGVGLAALWLGWLTLRPNRLAGGVSLNLLDSLGGWGAAMLAVLWLVVLAACLWRGRSGVLVAGIAANAALAVTFGFAGAGAQRLLADGTPLARVSLGPGIWLTAAAVYLVVSSARRSLTGGWAKATVTWSGGLALGALLAAGSFDSLSIMQEFGGQSDRFGAELLRHVALFAGSVTAGAALGVPLGIWAARSARAERPIFYLAGITQTIPSLALFGLLIAPLAALSFAFPWLRQWGVGGLGAAPAVIALIIYSLLPIVQNTFAGLRQVDAAVMDAGRGMGMSERQLFRRVQAPLAAPLMLEGLRTAAVQAVGNTAVAALIGAGGLGYFIFQGLGQAADDLILVGALPLIGLALAVDGMMRVMMQMAAPQAKSQ